LALRGKAGVAPETRQRVTHLAAELGYRVRPATAAPDRAIVALLLISRPDDRPDSAHEPTIRAMTEACTNAGVDVRLGSLLVDADDVPVDGSRLVARAGIDGYFVLGTWLSRASAALFGDRPVVLVDGDPEDPDMCSNVVSDDAGGAADATTMLVANGHRRILLVGTSSDAPPAVRERRRGYGQAMAAAGLEPRYVDGPADDPEDVAADAIAALDGTGRCTAVVAVNDAVALAVIAEAATGGISVPRDLSIVGFDDIEATRLVRPHLTTVTVSKPALGRLAAAMLLHRLDHLDDPPFTVFQRARLVERETVAAPLGMTDHRAGPR
jgi:LacI family transcriptional regulator